MICSAISATIIGLGAYIPNEIRKNDFWPDEIVEKWKIKSKENRKNVDIMDVKDNLDAELSVHPVLEKELKGIVNDPFVGMKERRVSKILPSEMARIACEEALKDADVNPEEIELFMGFSLPGDQAYPPDVFKLHYELGLNNARCFEVNSICYSFLSMLDIAYQYIKNGVVRKVLLFTSNKYSQIMDYTSSVSVAAGDGAVAIVLDSCNGGCGIQTIMHRVESYFHDAMYLTRRMPLRNGANLFNTNDVSLETKTYFTIREAEKARELLFRIPKWAESMKTLLFGSDSKFNSKNIDLLITNSAFIWYGRVVAKIFNLPIEKLEDNILRYSNMGGVNLPMNLYVAYKKGILIDGTNVAFFSHGGGASYGGGVLKWHKVKS